MGRSKLIPFAHYAAVLAVGLATAGVAQAQVTPIQQLNPPPPPTPQPQVTQAPQPPPSAVQTLRNLIQGPLPTAGIPGGKIVYVIAVPASDATTRMLYLSAIQLQKLTAGAWFVPRAEWGTGDLQTACKEGYAKGVVGGIVLEATVGTTGTEI